MRRSLAWLALVTIGCGGGERREPAAEQVDASSPAPASVSSVLARLEATPHLRVRPVAQPFLTARGGSYGPSAPLAGGLAVELPRLADGAAKLSRRETTAWIEPDGMRPAEGVLAGNGVVWADASPDVDLVQLVDPEAVEELRVLRRPTPSYAARWRIRAQGATLRARERRLELVDPKGVVVIGTAPIVAIDAAGARFAPVVTVAHDGDGALAEATFALEGASFPVVVDPGWTSVTRMANPRNAHTSTLLGDGTILVAGGAGVDTETYDPATNTWSDAGMLHSARFGQRAARLPSGKVLIAGGFVGSDPTSTAEIYDPATRLWTVTGSMASTRAFFGMEALDDGKVLAVAGLNKSNIAQSSAERFDEVGGAWSASGALATPRHRFGAAALSGGRLLVMGGLDVNYARLSTVEAYESGGFAARAPMVIRRHSFIATALPDGNVLVAGGLLADMDTGNITSAAEIYDPATDQWSAKQPMLAARASHRAALLSPTRLLVVGGQTYDPVSGTNSVLSTAELFDLATNTWQAAQTAPGRRFDSAIVALGGGKALLTGGTIGYAPQNNAEIYALPVLGDACGGLPSDACAPYACVEGVCCDTTCGGACESCLASKKGAGSDGTCGAIADGADPDHECASSCSGADLTTRACNGARACRVAATAPCPGGYACGSAGSCRASCGVDGDCASTYYCVGAACAAKKPLGGACAAARECASGLCADGVCCDDACAGACRACTAAKKGSGADGSCGTIANGADPDHECAAASCAGVTLTKASVCDGAGACRGDGTVDCAAAGYTCNVAAKACRSTCSGDADCASTHFCVGGACAAKKSQGATCGAARECTSGFCADGVCCDAACGAACFACSAAKKGGGGADGACGPIVDGADPDHECQAPRCSGAALEKRWVCGGAGACRADGSVDCAASGYACDASVAACRSACSTDAHCASTHWCSGGACVAKGAAGATCTAAGQCASGFCVDGVCCDRACASGCEACTAALKGSGGDGVCGPVPADADPKSACAPDVGYPASCRADGACDGSGACRVYAKSTTSCGATTCVDGKLAGLVCNGAGACLATTPRPCAPYACGGDACKTTCAGDADCSADAFCTAAGTCGFKRANGDACAAAKECGSGYCVDGTCCNAACTGQCEACDGPSKGTCAAVVGEPRGGRAPCRGDGACKGACDGTQTPTCAYPTASKDCGTSCADARRTARACDGAGACVTSAPTSCNGYACADANGCREGCDVADDCAVGYVCVAKACVPATAKCSADGTQSIDATGATTPCGAYACEAATGRCYQVCGSSADCLAGAVCELSTRQCVSPSSETGSDGGCSAAPGEPQRAGVGLLALAFALGLVRRRAARGRAR